MEFRACPAEESSYHSSEPSCSEVPQSREFLLAEMQKALAGKRFRPLILLPPPGSRAGPRALSWRGKSDGRGEGNAGDPELSLAPFCMIKVLGKLALTRNPFNNTIKHLQNCVKKMGTRVTIFHDVSGPVKARAKEAEPCLKGDTFVTSGTHQCLCVCVLVCV